VKIWTTVWCLFFWISVYVLVKQCFQSLLKVLCYRAYSTMNLWLFFYFVPAHAIISMSTVSIWILDLMPQIKALRQLQLRYVKLNIINILECKYYLNVFKYCTCDVCCDTVGRSKPNVAGWPSRRRRWNTCTQSAAAKCAWRDRGTTGCWDCAVSLCWHREVCRSAGQQPSVRHADERAAFCKQTAAAAAVVSVARRRIVVTSAVRQTRLWGD